MKAVTEFASFTLNAALKVRATLAAEGKSPEEIQASLGTTYKLEGEKLGYFLTALDVAEANAQDLKRVMVVRLNEGETAPAKAVQTEDIAVFPEALVKFVPPKAKDDGKRGGRGGKGDRDKKGGPKPSPWGMSPEEKAEKLAKSQASQAALAAKKAAAAKK
ncbi:MAG: hypothetical protein U1E10_10530 [Bdellovibrionales bacterium]|jgi:hypothetical protein|nr:hypothetical protein [Bdellovibrionales bacterium]